MSDRRKLLVELPPDLADFLRSKAEPHDPASMGPEAEVLDGIRALKRLEDTGSHPWPESLTSYINDRIDASELAAANGELLDGDEVFERVTQRLIRKAREPE